MRGPTILVLTLLLLLMVGPMKLSIAESDQEGIVVLTPAEAALKTVDSLNWTDERAVAAAETLVEEVMEKRNGDKTRALSFEVWLRGVKLARARKRYDHALVLLDEMRAFAIDNPHRGAVIHYLKGTTLVSLSEFKQKNAKSKEDAGLAAEFAGRAIEELQSAVALNAGHDDASYYLAQRLSMRGQNVSQVLELLSPIGTGVNTLNDYYVFDVLALRGKSFRVAGDSASAMKAFEAIGVWYDTHKDLKEWVEKMQARVFKLRLAECFTTLATMLLENDRPKEAYAITEKFQSELSQVWQIPDILAVALHKLGQYEESLGVHEDTMESMKMDIKIPQGRESAERVFGTTLAMLDLEKELLDKEDAEEDAGASTPPPPPRVVSPRTGGWSQATDKARYTARCDVPRRAADNFTTEEFLRDFVDRSRPVLITGALENWTAWQHWTREAMLQKYKDGWTVVRRSWNDEDYAESGKDVYNISFGRFVDDHMHAVDEETCAPRESTADDKDSEGGNPLYVSATFSSIPNELFDGVYADSPTPRFFESQTHFAYPEHKRREMTIFYAGPALSGTNVHAHTNAFNALVYGQKRWFLFPPYRSRGPAVAMSMTRWIDEVYPSIQDQTIECVQESGELLYIPTHWHHGVLNLKDSLGVSTSLGPTPNLVWKNLRRIRKKYAKEAKAAAKAATKEQKNKPKTKEKAFVHEVRDTGAKLKSMIENMRKKTHERAKKAKGKRRKKKKKSKRKTKTTSETPAGENLVKEG